MVVIRRLLFSREVGLESQNSSDSYSKNERGGKKKILLVCLRNTPDAQCAKTAIAYFLYWLACLLNYGIPYIPYALMHLCFFFLKLLLAKT